MRTYRCHKHVKAAQIVAIAHSEDGLATQFLLSGETDPRPVPEGERFQGATLGSYLIEYEDGYLSVSPQAAFEDGYTLITSCWPVMGG